MGYMVLTFRSKHYGTFNAKANVKPKEQSTAATGRNRKGRVAVGLLRQNRKIRQVTQMTSVSNSTVGRLAKLIREGDHEQLHAYIDTTIKVSGRNSVLSAVEEQMLLDQIVCAASRGLSINDGMLKTLMAKIASDRRPGWKKGIPGPDAIRSFRARHREMAYRNQKEKDNARLKGENYYHVDTFFRRYVVSKYQTRDYCGTPTVYRICTKHLLIQSME